MGLGKGLEAGGVLRSSPTLAPNMRTISLPRRKAGFPLPAHLNTLRTSPFLGDYIDTTKHFHCDVCNLSYPEEKVLRAHFKTAKHLRKEAEVDNPIPFFCVACNLGYHKHSFTRHEKDL